jgi:hypothetical protein
MKDKLTNDHGTDDLHLQGYQDSLDTKGVDEILHETTDEPMDTTGVPNKALKPELDKLAFDDMGQPDGTGGDDERESLEDMDEGDLDKKDR